MLERTIRTRERIGAYKWLSIARGPEFSQENATVRDSDAALVQLAEFSV